jgi:O-antigen/teichoic acid export membrane protein
MKNHKFSLTISSIIAITAVFYVVYYLLLCDNGLHTSISSIISYSHQLHHKKRLLILGLLPIYIAAMIFGAAILGIYLGSRLKYIRLRNVNENKWNP